MEHQADMSPTSPLCHPHTPSPEPLVGEVSSNDHQVGSLDTCPARLQSSVTSDAPASYRELKLTMEERIDTLPMFFAFNQEQFDAGTAALGAQVEELTKVAYGGFMKQQDAPLFHEVMAANEASEKAFLSTDEGLHSALVYELHNHEYGYTCDPTDALDSLGLAYNDERVQSVLPRAIKEVLQDEC